MPVSPLRSSPEWNERICDTPAWLQARGKLPQERIECSELVIDRDSQCLEDSPNRVFDQIVVIPVCVASHKVRNNVGEIGRQFLEWEFRMRF